VTSDDVLLKKVLTYHVVPGRLTTQDILAGAGGGSAIITISNVAQSNGEIQVINGVLMPLTSRSSGTEPAPSIRTIRLR
jgi:uncharacterized surface protein with fasciclin (FAS1) repeats